jgi:hypothetical protein
MNSSGENLNKWGFIALAALSILALMLPYFASLDFHGQLFA